MLESQIEKRLKLEAEKIGGKYFKFVSPGNAGVPDRIVLLPGARIYFIELKAPGKELRKLQKYRKKQIEQLGFTVLAIDSIEGIKNFIKEVQ